MLPRVGGKPRAIKNIYASLPDAANVLAAHPPRPANSAQAASLDAFNRSIERLATRLAADPGALRPPPERRRFHFLVIEGLDGSGKSSAAAALAGLLPPPVAATRTPPKSLASIRPLFDAAEESVQRAFYAAGNYVAAEEILSSLDAPNPPRTVLCDRYFNSTVSWTAASSDLTAADLASLSIPFPADLLPPDLVLFLDVPQAERLRRTGKRAGEENISFEAKLEDEAFGNRVREAFGRVEGVPFEAVDGNRTVAEIAEDMARRVLRVGDSAN
ncbi:P-loop containing nucleoside triphosphate hydrolase protein [Hyaloraphidium curvatum]|nr:P-loop containing nucleoside triphosphate hydrolase protein [Hyaloraphidium curvatum]